MHEKLLIAHTLSDVVTQHLFGLISVKWALCGREVANVFTSESGAGYLLNWNQVATIKQSHKQTTLRLCNTLCWFLVSSFRLVNGPVLSLPHHCALIFFFSFFPPHSVINRIKPGTIRRVNRLPTPIAGLVSLFFFLSLLMHSHSVISHFSMLGNICWVNIWKDFAGETEIQASVICPAAYPSTLISSVNRLRLGACKCSLWCASGSKKHLYFIHKYNFAWLWCSLEVDCIGLCNLLLCLRLN